MLDLEELTLQNFGSFGNYRTTIPLGRLGLCHISGEVLNEPINNMVPVDGQWRKGRSNGSGKSTIVNGILWVLFGRTMHRANPGDKVINWDIGKDCVGSLRLANGDVITRTRRTEGHNELVVERNGDALADTRGTTGIQQAELARRYNLDWDVFTGSTFFTQFGKGWLEMGDQARKNAMERALRIDRFTIYGEVAKEKLSKLLEAQGSIRAKISNKNEAIAYTNREIEANQAAQAEFEQKRHDRVLRIVAEAQDYKTRAGLVQIPNVDDLRKVWQAIDQVKQKVAELQQQRGQCTVAINTAANEIRRVEALYSTWKQRGGKICTTCEQAVPESYAAQKAAPFEQQLAELRAAVKAKQDEDGLISRKIGALQEKAAAVAPKHTVREAEAIRAQRDNLQQQVVAAVERAKAARTEVNPHLGGLQRLQDRLGTLEGEVAGLQTELEQLDFLVRHATYVHRAYSDRKKIKSYAVAKYRPFFNKRLRHYLDYFQWELNFELSDSLSFDSDNWDYDFLSGGERRQMDLAYMLAVFDLREKRSGRQSSVVVLDEVDGRLDEAGIASLVEIIKNELASRVRTILVISHRKEMQDSFPHSLRVCRQNRFSTIQEIR